MNPWLFALPVLWVTCVAAADLGVCVDYPAKGLCAGFIDYQVYVPLNSNVTALENRVRQTLGLYAVNGQPPNATTFGLACGQSLMSLLCSSIYSRCGSRKIVDVPCLDVCTQAVATCTPPLTKLNRTALIPSCTTLQTYNIPYPTKDCLTAAELSTIAANKAAANAGKSGDNPLANPAVFAQGCPLPFLLYGNTSNLDPVTARKCAGPCCLPCPLTDFVYPSGSADLALNIVLYIRVASTAFAFFIALSYLILPGYRSTPRNLVLYVALCLFIWQSGALWNIGKTDRTKCVDAFVEATQDNNWLCLAQGILVIFGALSVVMWSAWTIINLHMALVWKKDVMERYIKLAHVFCWLVPAGLTAATAGLKDIKYEFGNVCFVSQEISNGLFFIPLAFIIFPMFFLHLWTCIAIFRVTYKASVAVDVTKPSSHTGSGAAFVSSRSRVEVEGSSNTLIRSRNGAGSGSGGTRAVGTVVAGLRALWRPALMSSIVSVTFVTFWLFYILQLKQLLEINPQSNPAVLQWIVCLFQTHLTTVTLTGSRNTGNIPQDTCFNFISPVLPSLGMIVTVEVLVSISGILVMLVFGTRLALYQDWKTLFQKGFKRNNSLNASTSPKMPPRVPRVRGAEPSPPMSQYSPTKMHYYATKRPGSYIGDVSATPGPTSMVSGQAKRLSGTQSHAGSALDAVFGMKPQNGSMSPGRSQFDTTLDPMYVAFDQYSLPRSAVSGSISRTGGTAMYPAGQPNNGSLPRSVASNATRSPGIQNGVEPPYNPVYMNLPLGTNVSLSGTTLSVGGGARTISGATLNITLERTPVPTPVNFNEPGENVPRQSMNRPHRPRSSSLDRLHRSEMEVFAQQPPQRPRSNSLGNALVYDNGSFQRVPSLGRGTGGMDMGPRNPVLSVPPPPAISPPIAFERYGSGSNIGRIR
ncbi:hypothetical protein BJ742DRAFT_767675 [Cladochytrium replicatum]|nr:hypothetical protein BJ742DRAFT_767675 [Cladochytrium replicatum]